MFKPTAEQAAGVEISTKLKPGELALGNAYAGAGKTTLLKLIGGALPSLGWSALYVCYNADMAREASKTLPANVTCKTSHSLAYGPMMRRFPQWKSRLGNLRARDVQLAFRIGTAQEAQAVCDTFAYFLCSPLDKANAAAPADTFTTRLVADAGWGFLDTSEAQAVVRGCKALFASTFENTGPKLPVPHDAYLWAYVHSDPVLPYDMILIDEGQDMNRLMIRFIRQQMAAGKRIGMVGDRHQGIYGWRLAVNALEIMDELATHRFSLTESFRFPQSIATPASKLLNDFKGDPVRIVGRGRGHPGFKPSQCFIARTNARLVHQAATLLRNGNARIHFAATREIDGYKPTSPYKFEEIRDVYRLWSNQGADRLRTPWLRQFPSYETLLEYASPAGQSTGADAGEEKGGDAELLAMVKLVDAYRYDTLDLLLSIEGAATSPENARWCLSSAHRSKGKEWDITTLSDDFLPLDDSAKMADIRSKLSKREFHEAVNLFYVAVTRGKSRIVYPQNCRNYFQGPAPATSVSTNAPTAAVAAPK